MILPKQIAVERHLINSTIRSFLTAKEYLEVETPIVVRSPGMEPNLVPFETTVIEANLKSHSAAMITSPEYSMKKLLGQGLEKIFTITKVFRNEESLGGNHNPEFTMLEWYTQGSDYQVCMDETEEMIREVAKALAPTPLDPPSGRGEISVPILPLPKGELEGVAVPFKRTRVRDLFLKHVQIDLDQATTDSLKQACLDHRIHFAENDTESDLFYRLFLALIEPNLGTDPIFVYDYPIHQAALSQLTSDGKYGQRFELYINGLELCNGFTELTDATEQRKRFEEEAKERENLGKRVYPIDENLLSLLPSLRSPTFGNALGIDRLHMVLTQRTRIQEVLLFPADTLFN